MPQEVLDRVEYIATRQNSPLGLVITRTDNTPYETIAPDNVSVQSNSNSKRSERIDNPLVNNKDSDSEH